MVGYFMMVIPEKNSITLGLLDSRLVSLGSVSFDVRKGEDKFYYARTPTGEIVYRIGPDFLDEFMTCLAERRNAFDFDEEMEDFEDIEIASFDDSKEGEGLFLTVENRCVYIKMSKNGKEAIFKKFKDGDELENFIWELEDAIAEALEG